jgi:succinoglycan biosynthesis protein ExoA
MGENQTIKRGTEGHNLPTVSVIIPMKNEEQHIARCLQSVVDQDYPEELIEVLVVDGMSEDSSQEIVADFARRYSFIKLLHNPKQCTTCALNKGITESRGEVIIRVDAHCSIDSDYIDCCVNTLKRSEAENVGGLMRPTGNTFVENTIALAMSSPFGVGSGKFHYCQKEMFVDTVYLGAYRREVFERIGLYDEEAHYGEDDELNYRLINDGGKIFLCPGIKSKYYPRSSLRTLMQQYYNYGRGKVRTIKKHGRPVSLRHLVPPIFVLSVLGSSTACLISPMSVWLVAAVCGSYFISTALVSAKIGFREGWKYFPLLPVAFAAMHLGYGTGFLYGAFRLALPDRIRLQRRKQA